MKSLSTKLLFDKHYENIKIFFEANDFNDVRITSYIDMEEHGPTEMIRIFYSEEDESALMFMGLRHAGIQNMLDDFLLKCGISPYELHAPKILNTKDAMEIAMTTK